MMKLDIIIPVYNSEKYLYDTVKSILIQKVKNTEIILINDCSTDKTNKICRNLSKNYSFIKSDLINEENLREIYEDFQPDLV